MVNFDFQVSRFRSLLKNEDSEEHGGTWILF